MNDEIKIYVSPIGADMNNGSAEKPFATIQRAVAEVRKLINDGLTAPVTVYFHGGNYAASGIELTSADSGTEQYPIKYCAYGDGEVVFTNGKILSSDSFENVSGEASERLCDDARKNVLVCDLKKYGIALNECGNLYDITDESAAVKNKGTYEIFLNDRRMRVAKYPNNDFLFIEDVCDDTDEEARIFMENYDGGKVLVIDSEANEHVKKWKNPELACMHGYFYWDWSDDSTEVVRFDTSLSRAYAKNIAGYGVRKGGYYYFYNVFEELDEPGEYYIDKENLLLYIYPMEDIAATTVMLSLMEKPILTAQNIEYVTFDGITFKGASADGIRINGNHCSMINCKMLDIYNWALRLQGDNNTIYGCDVSHTGWGGISVCGGNNTTLTASGNVIENTYVHDWSEVKLTAGAGIELCGCGNIARHNELARTSQMAIYYNGNDHLIEYNYIHDVVQQSNDAGAIYGGREWGGYGDILRYNIIENVGNEKYTPVGIYWDDCQSGQTAYGNIIKNATGKAFLIGGGRDNVVKNNMMIESEYPMLFDERGIEGVVANGWYGGALKGGNNWPLFNMTLAKSEIWRKRFPTLADVNDDFDHPEDPNFAPNPSRAQIKNNVCVCSNDYGFFVAPTVKKLGTVENNPVFASESECFVADGSYELKPEVKALLPEFEAIPVAEIGRYKK